MTKVDPRRVIADLRELERRTGGPDGARRLCWTEDWSAARAFLRERLAELDGVRPEEDEAGNLWARLPGRGPETVAVGSHLDSVPGGGWLDGALGVMAALEVLRVAAESGAERSVALVDFADEEGARFGRSLFGSSAVGGTLDPAALEGLRDSGGRAIREVLAENGVDLDAAPRAGRMLEGLAAYLELHIEQGPVLESEGIPAAAVTGTVGVERHRFRFEGQTAHAGTTPMDMRRDAGLAAAATALAVEELASRHGGVGTCGAMGLEPGVVTAVPGVAELAVDLRHAAGEPLAAMLEDARRAARTAASAHGCALAEHAIWRIEPIAFDQRLVEAIDTDRTLVSGALHDAAEMARHVPTAMVFAPSTGGLSHTKEEDTPEPHLERAIEAYGDLALRVIAGELV
ncbi:MAG TPA: Zn-dependent hydrolase [Thermoleophilaceae bacterium]|nr:Zn-dependent hydrolase [Thermoleophilaceae bacterium]